MATETLRHLVEVTDEPKPEEIYELTPEIGEEDYKTLIDNLGEICTNGPVSYELNIRMEEEGGEQYACLTISGEDGTKVEAIVKGDMPVGNGTYTIKIEQRNVDAGKQGNICAFVLTIYDETDYTHPVRVYLYGNFESHNKLHQEPTDYIRRNLAFAYWFALRVIPTLTHQRDSSSQPSSQDKGRI